MFIWVRAYRVLHLIRDKTPVILDSYVSCMFDFYSVKPVNVWLPLYYSTPVLAFRVEEVLRPGSLLLCPFDVFALGFLVIVLDEIERQSPCLSSALIVFYRINQPPTPFRFVFGELGQIESLFWEFMNAESLQ